MAWLMKGEIKTATRTLRRNRGRSLLTMFGIIIGVASVVTMVGIGEGIKDQVGLQTNRLGKDLITIRPGDSLARSSGTSPFDFSWLLSSGTGGQLQPNDITTVQHTPGVVSVVPLSIISGGITSGEHNRHYDALVIGTEPNLPSMLHQDLAYGTFFDNTSTAADKVIIGSHIAQVLYDESVPLGQSLTILGKTFIVTGIFSDFQTAPLSVDADFNNAVFISYDTARQMTNGSTPLYEILARPRDAGQTGAVVDRLTGSLLAAHGGQRDFTVLAQQQTISVTQTILNLLTTLISGVAAIALIIAGVGIMNVMLVSVTERMHEIGIRKAIGATNSQILRQFIVEAAVLSVTGGLIGVVLSFVVAIGLRLMTSLTPMITWQVVLIACGVSIAVGVLFGTIPALKAARKDPISALRNE